MRQTIFAILIVFACFWFAIAQAPGPTYNLTSTAGSAPGGSAGGDLSGTYPNPVVAQVNQGAIPTSAQLTGTNSLGKFTAVSVGSGLALSGGTLTASAVAPSVTTYSGVQSCSTTPFLDILTDSYYNLANCDGSSNLTFVMDGKKAYLPAAAANWTEISGNSGTAAIANSKGAITLSTTSSVASVEAALKAVPSTPYTKTIAFRALEFTSSSSNAGVMTCGFILTPGSPPTSSSAWQMYDIEFESTSTAFVPQEYALVEAAHAASFTTNASIDKYFGLSFLNPSSTIWIQVTDNGTNRVVSFSVDGVNFAQLYSGTSTSPFTPTYYGVACRPQTSGTGVPWLLTLLSDN